MVLESSLSLQYMYTGDDLSTNHSTVVPSASGWLLTVHRLLPVEGGWKLLPRLPDP